MTEKPSFWFTFAKLQANWADFRQFRVSILEKTRFLRLVGQRVATWAKAPFSGVFFLLRLTPNSVFHYKLLLAIRYNLSMKKASANDSARVITVNRKYNCKEGATPHSFNLHTAPD